MKKLDHSYINGRSVEWHIHSEKEFGSSSKKKIKHAAIMQSDYCTAGIYPTEMKTYVHTKHVHKCS